MHFKSWGTLAIVNSISQLSILQVWETRGWQGDGGGSRNESLYIPFRRCRAALGPEWRKSMFMGRALLLLRAFKSSSGSDQGLNYLLHVYACGTRWKGPLANCKLHTAERHTPLISTTCSTHLAINNILFLSSEKSYKCQVHGPIDPKDATHLAPESYLRPNLGLKITHQGTDLTPWPWREPLQRLSLKPGSQTCSSKTARRNTGCLVRFEFR